MDPRDAKKDGKGHWGGSPTAWVVLCTQGPTPYLLERPEGRPECQSTRETRPPHSRTAAAMQTGQSTRGGKTLAGEKLRPLPGTAHGPLAHAPSQPGAHPGKGGPLSQPLTLSLMHLTMEGGHPTRATGSVHCKLDCVQPQASCKETASPPRGTPGPPCSPPGPGAIAVPVALSLPRWTPAVLQQLPVGAPRHLKIASQHRAECKSKASEGPSDLKVLIPIYFFLGCVLRDHDKNTAAPCISQRHENF